MSEPLADNLTHKAIKENTWEQASLLSPAGERKLRVPVVVFPWSPFPVCFLFSQMPFGNPLFSGAFWLRKLFDGILSR